MEIHKKTTSFELTRDEKIKHLLDVGCLDVYCRNKIQPFLDELAADGWAWDTNILYHNEYISETGNTKITAEIMVTKADDIGIKSDRISSETMSAKEIMEGSITFKRAYPTIETFIRARLVQDRSLFSTKVYTLLVDILNWHQNWPVLVTGEFEVTQPDPDSLSYADLNKFTYQISQKMEWMTNQEYVRRFGESAPTAPLLLMMARMWKDHEDFDPRWSE